MNLSVSFSIPDTTVEAVALLVQASPRYPQWHSLGLHTHISDTRVPGEVLVVLEGPAKEINAVTDNAQRFIRGATPIQGRRG
jgi:hypothetical protein